MQRILVTGGCGFVGASLITHLEQVGGYEITVLDNESLGTFASLGDLKIVPIMGDLRDPEAVTKAVDGQDAIVHLAADTRVIDSIENPQVNFDVNVVGTFNLLTAARDAGVRRVVNASTGGAILGDVPPPVDETMPAAPVSPYGASKLAVEGYCSAFGACYGLSAVSLRFSNVYGPLSFHKGSVVALFMRQIIARDRLTVYGDGTQSRDYVYSQDLAKAIRLGLESDVQGAIQLGTGIPTSINELLDALRVTVGPDYAFDVDYVDFRTGEVMDSYCNIGKARELLGYEPTTQLADGLAKTWDWFLSETR